MTECKTHRDSAAAIARWIAVREIPFERGEPEAYFRRVLSTVRRLNVDEVSTEHQSTSCLTKGLFVLWAIVVDDALDRHGDRGPLDASTRWLAAAMSGDVPLDTGTHAEAILRIAFGRLRTCVDAAAMSVLYLDVWEQVHGLQYEALFNRLPGIATAREYTRCSTLVASIKIYVDIDHALAGQSFSGPAYRRVRSTCDELGVAIKCASDIGTLSREIEEGAPNLVALRLRDAGFDLLTASDDSKGQHALQRVIRATETEARRQVAGARKKLRQGDHALGRLCSLVERIVLEYCAGDPFFDDDPPEKKPGNTSSTRADTVSLTPEALRDHLDDLLPPAEQAPTSLHRAMRAAVLDGGKRVRPRLLFAVFGAACGGDATPAQRDFALRAASAIELVHSASLVHDDLPCFDDADTRRGRPTVHRAFGEANATLAGDALIVLAFQLLSEPAAPLPGRRLEFVHQLALATGSSEGIIGGQGLEEVLSANAVAQTIGTLAPGAVERYHALKTAALFRLAAQAGAAAACSANIDAWADLGARLGLAFQLADDLIDVEGGDAGKPVGQDAAHGRPNRVLCEGRLVARRQFATLLDGAITSVMELASDPQPLLSFLGRLSALLDAPASTGVPAMPLELTH